MLQDLADMFLVPVRGGVSLRKAVLQAQAADSKEFRETLAHVAQEMFEQGRYTVVVQNLATAGLVEHFLADPFICSEEQARRIAHDATVLDGSTPVRIARYLIATDSLVPVEYKFRLLGILSHLLDAEKATPILAMLLSRADPRVRSRAVKVLRCGLTYASFIREQLQNEDSRVRANAVESLWNHLQPAHENILRKCIQDPNQRVRGNALYALHKLNVVDAKALILTMAKHNEAAFRTTAAWVMGYTEDPYFIPALEQMARSDEGAPRLSALRGMARIRNRMRSGTTTTADPPPPLPPQEPTVSVEA